MKREERTETEKNCLIGTFKLFVVFDEMSATPKNCRDVSEVLFVSLVVWFFQAFREFFKQNLFYCKRKTNANAIKFD